MAANIFKCICLNKNFWILNKISLKYIRYGVINMTALVQIMALRRTGEKPLSKAMMFYWCIYATLSLSELRLSEGLLYTLGPIMLCSLPTIQCRWVTPIYIWNKYIYTVATPAQWWPYNPSPPPKKTTKHELATIKCYVLYNLVVMWFILEKDIMIVQLKHPVFRGNQ